MVSLAVDGKNHFTTDPVELIRGGTSYTVDTVRYFRSMMPDSSLYLIMGVDSFELFESWKEPEVIKSCCNIAVVSRSGFGHKNTETEKDIHAKFRNLPVREGNFIYFTDMKPCQASSTFIRKNISDRGLIEDMIPSKVLYYIRKRKLYESRK